MTPAATVLDAALEYATRGDPVFPVWHAEGGRCGCRAYDCEDQGKHPIASCARNGCLDATTDPATLTRWFQTFPRANLAMRTGLTSTVVDVDPDKGGLDTMARLTAQHGSMPVTAKVLTGGGGYHLHFAPVPGLRNSVGVIGPGVDVRGEGGYVLLAPSNHKSGGAYRDDPDAPLYDTPRTVMPAWLVELARRSAASNGSSGNGHRPPDEWAAKLMGAPEGQRRAVALEIAGHYLGRGIPEAEVLGILRGFAVQCVPPFSERETEALVSDLARRDRAKATGLPAEYIESLSTFFAEDDPPAQWIFPDFLPADVLMLIHGEPRARKSLVGFELALSAATGTAPFGLAPFKPAAPIKVLYVQEEDTRSLTRPRLRRLVRERCGGRLPDTLKVVVRRGVDLDDPAWVARLTDDIQRLGIRLLVLDAMRRLSIKTDEGPAKVRELIAVLRSIVTVTSVTIVVVHHDIKPPQVGTDQRRRSQRASGGDWFAACECPVHVERVNEAESLVYPQDYKFSADPDPFTFTCAIDGKLIKALVGTGTTTESAETAGLRGRLLAWLSTHRLATKTDMKTAGFGWAAIEPLLDGLQRTGLVDSVPGKRANSVRFFVVNASVSEFEDGRAVEAVHAS